MHPGTDKSRFSNDKKLLAGCMKGRQKAWDAFLERYSGLIFHAIRKTLERYSFIAKEQVVDDLFQRVFLSLMESDCRKFRQFQWKCKLSTWLYTVAVRMTMDYARKEGLSASLKDDVSAAIPDHLPLPDSVVEMKQEHIIYEKIKQKLSPREQLFLKLLYDRELPVAQIAGIMDITENNVYQLKNRVTRKMKKILNGFS